MLQNEEPNIKIKIIYHIITLGYIMLCNILQNVSQKHIVGTIFA